MCVWHRLHRLRPSVGNAFRLAADLTAASFPLAAASFALAPAAFRLANWRCMHKHVQLCRRRVVRRRRPRRLVHGMCVRHRLHRLRPSVGTAFRLAATSLIDPAPAYRPRGCDLAPAPSPCCRGRNLAAGTSSADADELATADEFAACTSAAATLAGGTTLTASESETTTE